MDKKHVLQLWFLLHSTFNCLYFIFFYVYFLDTATALHAAQHDVWGELILKLSSWRHAGLDPASIVA